MLFAVAGPAVLSVAYGGAFFADMKWLYPFAWPAWAFGVTAVKVAVMLAWLCTRGQAPAEGHRPGRFVAGVFFVGGMHALVGATANLLFAPMHVLNALSVAAAAVAGVFYLRAYCDVRRAPRGRKPMAFGDLVTVAILAACVLGGLSIGLFLGRMD